MDAEGGDGRAGAGGAAPPHPGPAEDGSLDEPHDGARDHDHPEGVDLSGVVPVRRASWREKDDGRVVVERPRPRTSGLKGLLDRVSHALSMRYIRLDETGSFAWKQIDGRSTAGEVAERMRRELGDDAEPAEERLGEFVVQLHSLHLVALPGIDPPEVVSEAAAAEAGPPDAVD